MTLEFPSAPTIPDLESQINNRQNRVYGYCPGAETQNDYTISINLDGVQVNQTTQSKYLGPLTKISPGSPMCIKSQKKVPSGIGALKRVRPFVFMHTAVKIQYLRINIASKFSAAK